MILFINVLLTDKRHKHYNDYNRGLYTHNTPNPVRIFKYMLESLAVIPWSKAFIYCELDDNYAQHTDELAGLAKGLFPEVEYFDRRNSLQEEWQKALGPVLESNDELIWYSGNHDHIFIDYDLEVLQAVTDAMLNRLPDESLLACVFSHWPEMLGNLLVFGAKEKNRSHFVSCWKNTDSIQIVSKAVLREWWWSRDYGETFIPRTDHVIEPVPLLIFVPLRELCRHFDAYDRGGNLFQNINHCPPLDIPLGYEAGQMKISVGQPLPDHLLIDPTNPFYRAAMIDGADLRCLPEDLPLFWKNKVTLVKHDYDREEWVRCRNDVVWILANAAANSPPLPTREELAIAMR